MGIFSQLLISQSKLFFSFLSGLLTVPEKDGAPLLLP
jgi:hypothetical protein